MAPSLGKAYSRRWWIGTTAILENLMFAAVLLGWSSFLLMLKNEGYYAYMCYGEDEVCPEKGDLVPYDGTSVEIVGNTTVNALNTTGHDEMIGNTTEKIRYTPSGYRTCTAQDETLNRYFSIGSCLLSAVTIVLGGIMDRYGSRFIRLSGSIIFLLSCLLFAIGSMNPNELSILMAPAVCMNGMGGITYIFTSFPIPNFFAELRSTMISLMIGSYSASALIYMLFKAMYDVGVSFQFLMVMHGALAFLTFINALVNQPGVPIPAPGDLSYAISLKAQKKKEKYDQKKAAVDERFDYNNGSDAIGRRLSGVDIENSKDEFAHEEKKDVDKQSTDEPVQTFGQVLRNPVYLASVVTMCLTQLRLIAYMGWLEIYVRSSAERTGHDTMETNDLVSYYARLFGILQINCFLMAPVIGQIMDWNLGNKKGKKKNVAFTNGSDEIQLKNGKGTPDENGNAPNGIRRNVKKQQIMNLMRAFLITNIVLFVFGIIVQIDTNLPLQILAFVLHTVVRTFLHSSTGGLYAAMYHFSHFGKLTGVTSFTGAIFILIQDPLFVLINNTFDGNPYWVNFGMLIFTLTGFLLPFLLWREGRRLSDYEPVTSSDDRFCIADDGSSENLVAGAPSMERVNEDEQDVTLSKGALVF